MADLTSFLTEQFKSSVKAKDKDKAIAAGAGTDTADEKKNNESSTKTTDAKPLKNKEPVASDVPANVDDATVASAKVEDGSARSGAGDVARSTVEVAAEAEKTSSPRSSVKKPAKGIVEMAAKASGQAPAKPLPEAGDNQGDGAVVGAPSAAVAAGASKSMVSESTVAKSAKAESAKSGARKTARAPAKKRAKTTEQAAVSEVEKVAAKDTPAFAEKVASAHEAVKKTTDVAAKGVVEAAANAGKTRAAGAVSGRAASPTGRLGIRDMAEVREFTFAEMNERKLVHSAMPDRDVLNAYRELRTRLLQLSDGENFICMVSSFCDDDSATHVSANLAAAIALDQTKTALLIDCNLYDLGFERTLGLEAEYGVTDYLDDAQLDVADIIYASGVRRMRVIPIGGHIERGAEHFASQRMRQFFDTVKARYMDRFIIVNAPPIASSAEGKILTELCDWTVLVLPYGKVADQQLEAGVAMVPSSKMAGIVFHQ